MCKNCINDTKVHYFYLESPIFKAKSSGIISSDTDVTIWQKQKKRANSKHCQFVESYTRGTYMSLSWLNRCYKTEVCQTIMIKLKCYMYFTWQLFLDTTTCCNRICNNVAKYSNYYTKDIIIHGHYVIFVVILCHYNSATDAIKIVTRFVVITTFCHITTQSE